MIYTITPNPALDLAGSVEDLVPNEKNYVQEETRHPGGNGINAARIMRALGAPVCATGFLGGGAGEEILDLLKAEGVRPCFVPIEGHTRTNITVWNKKTRRQTRLSFAGPRIRAAESAALLKELNKADDSSLFVIGGSLPPGFGVSRIREVLQLAARRRIPCMVDVPAKLLGTLIRERPFFIKPNLKEFQELVGKKLGSRESVLREARRLVRKVPLVCVSSVEGGALLVSRDEAWFGRGPRVTLKSHVGAGDSLVGAIGAELWRERTRKEEVNGGELLRWGLAAAVATLSTPGTEVGSTRLIKKFYSQVRVERI